CINIPIPLGDGNKLKVGLDGISYVDADDTEVKFDLDSDEGTFSIDGVDADGEEFTYEISGDEEDGSIHFGMTGEDGEEYGMEAGENLEIPFAIPEDVPLMDDANV